jgi:hypothetical protein
MDEKNLKTMIDEIVASVLALPSEQQKPFLAFAYKIKWAAEDISETMALVPKIPEKKVWLN